MFPFLPLVAHLPSPDFLAALILSCCLDDVSCLGPVSLFQSPLSASLEGFFPESKQPLILLFNCLVKPVPDSLVVSAVVSHHLSHQSPWGGRGMCPAFLSPSCPSSPNMCGSPNYLSVFVPHARWWGPVRSGGRCCLPSPVSHDFFLIM